MYNSISIYGQPFITGFSPENIPNLTLWLDASDVSTVLISGSNVTQWNDKGSNGFNQSAYLIGGTVGPSYSTFPGGGINGLHAIDMSSYFSGNILSDLITSTEFTIFVSYKFRGTPVSTVSVQDKDAILGSVDNMGITVSDNFDFNVFNNDGVISSSSFPSDIPPLSNIGTYRHGAGNIEGAIDLAPLSGIVSGNTIGLGDDFTIGATQPGSGLDPVNLFPGRIGEIVIYNRALTSAEVMLMREYMFSKWKESVPSNAYTTPGGAEPYWDENLEIYTEAL